MLHVLCTRRDVLTPSLPPLSALPPADVQRTQGV